MDSLDEGAHGSREKILIAAATMLGEDPTARLSVRAVAARAGVSTGSLRHFFPTQQELLDTVMAGLYDIEFPEDPIQDTTKAAGERLVACLRMALSHSGTGKKARDMWTSVHEAYVQSQPSAGATETYLALERVGHRRIEKWLMILTEEGSIPVGDNEQRARFLGTVLTGLSVERVLPADGARPGHETDTLHMAAQCIMSNHPSTG